MIYKKNILQSAGRLFNFIENFSFLHFPSISRYNAPGLLARNTRFFFRAGRLLECGAFNELNAGPHKHCLKCQKWARTGTALDRCYPQRARTGPLLVHKAMFIGKGVGVGLG